MKQRHIQNFLVVSAAFFAMNATVRTGEAARPLGASISVASGVAPAIRTDDTKPDSASVKTSDA